VDKRGSFVRSKEFYFSDLSLISTDSLSPVDAGILYEISTGVCLVDGLYAFHAFDDDGFMFFFRIPGFPWLLWLRRKNDRGAIVVVVVDVAFLIPCFSFYAEASCFYRLAVLCCMA
jgi:hypothetical protein